MKGSFLFTYWLARTSCMIGIFSINQFAWQSFEIGTHIVQAISELFIHLLPSLIMLAFLIYAWKFEWMGGILFIATGILMTPLIFMHNYVFMLLPFNQCLLILLKINTPFILTGLLFMLNGKIKNNLPIQSI